MALHCTLNNLDFASWNIVSLLPFRMNRILIQKPIYEILILRRSRVIWTFFFVRLRKCMSKAKMCPQDSAPRPVPLWSVSHMQVVQRGPTGTPPTPVSSTLYSELCTIHCILQTFGFWLWLEWITSCVCYLPTPPNHQCLHATPSGINCCTSVATPLQQTIFVSVTHPGVDSLQRILIRLLYWNNDHCKFQASYIHIV